MVPSGQLAHSNALETIRERRDEARSLVKAGVNPNTHKQAERVEARRKVEAVLKQEAERQAADASVQDMFDEWIQHGVRRSDQNAALRRSFEKEVRPIIGETSVRLVSEKQLRDLLLSLVGRESSALTTTWTLSTRERSRPPN